MTRPPEDVPESELAVLQILWQRGEATRRQLVESLYPRGEPADFTTVQKLLERLEKRGLVRRGGTERQRTFRATRSRDELLSLRLEDLAERLGGGSLVPLVLNLVKTRPLTPDELQELRAFVREQGKSTE
jgi:BlaI family transcriptional regulator, penicillinase repressor